MFSAILSPGVAERKDMERVYFYRGVIVINDNDKVLTDGDVIRMRNGKFPSVGEPNHKRTEILMQALADLFDVHIAFLAPNHRHVKGRALPKAS